jgi:hypothetical protein
VAWAIFAVLAVVGAVRSANPALLVLPVVALGLAFAWTYRAPTFLDVHTHGIVLRTLVGRYPARWDQLSIARHADRLSLTVTHKGDAGRDDILHTHHLFEAALDGFFTIKREHRGRDLLDEIERTLNATRSAAA